MSRAEDEEQMPFVYRISQPLARKSIRKMGFDRRRRESRIYEYAIHRYYMDILEMVFAFLVIIARLYLAFDFNQPFSGSMPLQGGDVFIFLLTTITIAKNWQLLRDYRKNVVIRIEAISKSL